MDSERSDPKSRKERKDERERIKQKIQELESQVENKDAEIKRLKKALSRFQSRIR